MDVNTRRLSSKDFKQPLWRLLILSLLVISPMTPAVGEGQGPSSTATVKVYQGQPSPTGELRFASEMAKAAQITFSPLKVTGRTTALPIRQAEAQTSSAYVELRDTRKNHTHPSNYVVAAKVDDSSFGAYGLGDNQMRITIKPTTETFQVNNLRVVTLSEKVQPVFEVRPQSQSKVPLVVNLNPVLKIETLSDLDLQPGQKRVYGTQIIWTLTPKI